ncbi:penicillin-binding transpeptidase domain-containing protein [Mahella sp.]|uniref:peptidoglycan D,D-transpeptidase FtsI family protein n=1 Tax=Mahella sp. TaxID=2798721 RepID=UPI0025BDA6BF|nr:penicillin-binding transpeptidase domain-containing protein [Mahella sp.]MBZ4666735.1 penicillin-binding protein transpeptidase [Mahella sp.]
MNRIKRNTKQVLAVFAAVFMLLIGYLLYTYFFQGNRLANSYYNKRITQKSQEVVWGDIKDRNGEMLAVSRQKDGQWVRDYPYGKVTAHVVGYVDPKLGRAGIENSQATYLLGLNNGVLEQAVQRFVFHELHGNNVILTLDYRLQKAAYDALGNRRGAVVAMDPRTGEVLAMVSKPDFDPNNLAALSDKDALYNKALQGTYPPGSVFKVVTLASALENIQDIDSQTFTCNGYINVGDYKLSCSGNKAHGQLDITEALGVSCNTTFASIGLQLGDKLLSQTAETFLFNRTFAWDDMTVYASNFPKEEQITDDELAKDAIGQGKVTVTPMHMAMITSAIANDGDMMQPRLVKAVENSRGRIIRRFNPKRYAHVTDKPIADEITDMMVSVVTDGTGKSARISGVDVAGKTGTAQAGGQQEDHAWFISFAPADNPSIAVAVIVENAGTGGVQAAPVARKVMKQALILGYE